MPGDDGIPTGLDDPELSLARLLADPARDITSVLGHPSLLPGRNIASARNRWRLLHAGTVPGRGRSDQQRRQRVRRGLVNGENDRGLPDPEGDLPRLPGPGSLPDDAGPRQRPGARSVEPGPGARDRPAARRCAPGTPG